MTKSILIIEGKQKISEALLLACADRPIDGLNFYVAKTQQAADKLLLERDDIAAVITQGEMGLDLKLIDATQDLGKLNKILSTPVLDRERESDDDDYCADDRDCDFCDDDDDDDESFEADYECYKSASGIRRAVRLDDNNAAGLTGADLSEMLDLLERHDLLRPKSAHTYCPSHEAQANKVTELYVRVERLSKDIESIILDMKSVQHAVNNCPLKKSLISKALKDKKPETSYWKAITLAVLSLLGIIATALSGLLGKVIEIVLGYYYK